MAPQDFNVHDVNVRDTPSFGIGGTVGTNTVVTFHVGAHGPFTLTYKKEQATGAQIQQDIDAQVRTLRAIVGEP
jgi:hypothetical protein